MSISRRCAYAERARKASVNGAVAIPPCSGPITHRAPNYWLGDARKTLGPDMFLCATHAGFVSVPVMPLRKAKA